MKKYFPILQWLPGYDKDQLSGDLSAGLTVGVMLIPQGMAYAMLAGLPPIYGLYASTVPLILYAILGTSRQLAVGPAAMIALLIGSGVAQVAEVRSDDFIALAITLALMVGVIQLLLGIFRLGFLVNFLSHPVISGFTSAAALIIGINQLKHLLGLDIPRSNHIHTILIQAIDTISEVNIPTLLIGLGGIFTILLMKRISKTVPGPLVAVVLGTAAVYFLNMDEMGVKIVQEVPSGLPSLSMPTVSLTDMGALVPSALTLALVGFMESIAVATAMQARHKDYQIDSNQELIALGAANIGGSFFSAFPTAGGFGRTAVNDQAGARTGMASIISAALIMLTLLFLMPLFYFLPQAILASVIMVAVAGLVDFKEVRHLWKNDKRDLAMLLVTFLATLATGVEEGIGIGVILSLSMVLYRSSYPHMAVLGRIPGTNIFRNVKRFPNVEIDEQVAILRFDAQLFFANTSHFREEVDRLVRTKPQLRFFIVSAEAINALDSSAVHMLRDLIAEFKLRGIQLAFSAVKGPVRDILHRNGLVEQIGAANFFTSTADAVEAYEKQQQGEHPHSKYALQTNETKP